MAKAWLTTVKHVTNVSLTETLGNKESAAAVFRYDADQVPNEGPVPVAPSHGVYQNSKPICDNLRILDRPHEEFSSPKAFAVHPVETGSDGDRTSSVVRMKRSGDSIRSGRFHNTRASVASKSQQDSARSSSSGPLLATAPQKRKRDLQLGELSPDAFENYRKRSCLDQALLNEPYPHDVENGPNGSQASKCGSATVQVQKALIVAEEEVITSEPTDDQEALSRAPSVELEASSSCKKSTAELNGANNVPCPATPEIRKEDSQTAMKKKYQCKYCDQTFKKRKKLKKHIRHNHDFRESQEAHSVPSAALSGSKKKANKIYPYSCNCCNRKFRCKNEMVDHENMLKGIRAHTCRICSATFYTTQTLYNHERIHRETRYSCNICNKSFSTPRIMLEHIKVIHSKTKNFQCDHCEKAFCSKRYLATHMSNAHIKKPYICDLCGGAFFSFYRYNNHRNAVHNGIKPKHSCDQCKALSLTKLQPWWHTERLMET